MNSLNNLHYLCTAVLFFCKPHDWFGCWDCCMHAFHMQHVHTATLGATVRSHSTCLVPWMPSRKILAMGFPTSTYVRTVFGSELKLCKLEMARAISEHMGKDEINLSCFQNLHANTAARLSMYFMHIFCLLCLVDLLLFRSTRAQ